MTKATNSILKGRIYGREQGEMPIGPVLIIALIVLPLVFLLITYGGKIGKSFSDATTEVSGASSGAKITQNKIEDIKTK